MYEIEWIYLSLIFISGFVVGILVSFALRLIQSKTAKQLASELFYETEAQRKTNLDNIINYLKASFGNLSLQALSRSTDEFLKLAKEKLDSERQFTAKELESKKHLIDYQLKRMTAELENASKLMKELEADRIKKFGELSNQLKVTNEQTSLLMKTTNTLQEALASTKVRGQWGERMAEDVLQMAGFLENVNYLKQKAIAGNNTRPDFTFLLPKNLKLNMDVKFPLDNYIRFLETDSTVDKDKYRQNFLRDVRGRIKEVTTREYINPEQNTVDYALLFIPNEQIYAFIHENDSTILDDGIRNRVVFCSPITLYAVLAVIRQAVDNFSLEQTSNEILSLLGTFKKQWHEFLTKLELVGKRISDAQREYEALTTTRKRMLEKPLNRLESLRIQRDFPEMSDEDDDENINE